MSLRPLALAASIFALSACGAKNPEIALNVRAGSSVDLDAVDRLHLVIRGCETDQLAYNADIPLTGERYVPGIRRTTEFRHDLCGSYSRMNPDARACLYHYIYLDAGEPASV